MKMGRLSPCWLLFCTGVAFCLAISFTLTAQAQVQTHKPYPLQKEAAALFRQENTPKTELSSESKSLLAQATVSIIGAKQVGKKTEPLYSGSGTLISQDGLILTNCHVANPAAMGDEDLEVDKLIVSLLIQEDAPPVPTYFANLLVYDPIIDLAVIKIAQTLDGKRVSLEELNLPFVSIGNSDEVKLGDRLHIFGYPTIGGETITYTSGEVSGFDTEDPVGNRAWIKTSATIAGGNSGGLAANDKGELIGIPTRGGTASAGDQYTDCRVLQDTNGDGTVDGKDTCIPFGGFINDVRPVKWALPLIESAQKGLKYVSPVPSPYTERKQGESQLPEGVARLPLVGWSDSDKKLDDENCPERVLDTLPSNTELMLVAFKAEEAKLTKDERIFHWWFLDGEFIAEGKETYDSKACVIASIHNGGEAMPKGRYRVEIYHKTKVIIAEEEVWIGKPKKPVAREVLLKGFIKDADTGKGIPNIYVSVFEPSLTLDDIKDGFDREDVFSATNTDRNGKFILPDNLLGGNDYVIVVGDEKGEYKIKYGDIEVPKEGKEFIHLTIELNLAK